MEFTTTELWRLVGDGLALCYRGAAGYAVRLTPDAALVVSGEAVADLNYAVIAAGPAPEERLREFSQAVGARGVPIVLIVSAEVAEPLAPLAGEAGFRHVGSMPLMTCRATPATPPRGPIQVTRVAGTDDLRQANALVSRAFALPEDAVQRAFGPPLLASPGVDVFLAQQGPTPVSSVQTTRFGGAVGVWAMATPPEHQRKGAGRALLEHVMRYHREREATLFYLCATEAGYPLYERLGFRTAAEGLVWVAGHSTQVPG